MLQPEPQAQPQPQQSPMTAEQMAAWQQQWMQQQMAAMQQAYQLGYEHAAQQQAEEAETDEDHLPYDVAQLAQEEGMVDHSMFMRPPSMPKPEPSEPEVFAPEEEPEDEVWEDDAEDGWDAFDEDMTDAASAPPKSAYVGRDESARAKRVLWDKYLGGGGAE